LKKTLTPRWTPFICPIRHCQGRYDIFRFPSATNPVGNVVFAPPPIVR
jgi:hypothetical protein